MRRPNCPFEGATWVHAAFFVRIVKILAICRIKNYTPIIHSRGWVTVGY